MKKSKLLDIIKEILDEQEGGAVGNTTASVGPTAIPAAFAKPGQGDNRPTNMMVKDFGYTKIKMKKRPYDTKGFSYLDENK